MVNIDGQFDRIWNPLWDRPLGCLEKSFYIGLIEDESPTVNVGDVTPFDGALDWIKWGKMSWAQPCVSLCFLIADTM